MKVMPVENADIDFRHSPKLVGTGVADSIVSLSEVAAEQLITVKAEVSQISGVKTVRILHRGVLKKQEVLIRDTTSSIKVVLWEANVEILEEKKAYLLKNLKVKAANKERFLNTPKDAEFRATETAPFDEPLVAVHEGLFEMASSTISGRIIGIQQTNQHSFLSHVKQQSIFALMIMTLENATTVDLYRCLVLVEPNGTCVFLSRIQPINLKKSLSFYSQ